MLHATHAAQFQHMMRTLNSRVLAPLDPGRTGHVDLATLLMVLVALGCVRRAGGGGVWGLQGEILGIAGRLSKASPPRHPPSCSFHTHTNTLHDPPRSDGSARERIMAAFDVLSWKKGRTGVTAQDAQAYVATLHRIFSVNHDGDAGRGRDAGLPADLPLDEAGFLVAVTRAGSGFALYEALPALCHSLA